MRRGVSRRSVGEDDGANAEVRGASAGGLEALPDDSSEVAADRSGRPAGGHLRGQVEADPGDDAVLRVRARPLEDVEDGEEQLGADSRVERALDRAVVPLRARIRVVLAQVEVAAVAVGDP